MESSLWSDCSLVRVDPEVVHGEPVFDGTRMPVETAIESYYAFREIQGLSDEKAIEETLHCFPTIPSVEALRSVLAFEVSREPLLAP